MDTNACSLLRSYILMMEKRGIMWLQPKRCIYVLLARLGCHCPLVIPVGPLPTGNLKEMLLPLQGWGPGFLVSVGTGVMRGIPSLPYHLCCKEGGHSEILFLGVLGQLDPCSVLAAPKNGAEDHLLGLILGLQILLMSL